MPIRKIKAARVDVPAATWVGQEGVLFYDEAAGTLRIADGVTPGGNRIILNAEDINLAFGDFVADANNLSTVYPNEDLNLKSNGTGSVNIVGRFKIFNTAQGINGAPVFSVDSDGSIIVKIGTITTGQSGLRVDGTNGGFKPSQRPGTMLHVGGNDGVSSLIVNDSFGVGSVPSAVFRYARGTSFAPSATQLGDSFARFAGTGWGSSNYSIDPNAGSNTSIEFKATQDFTDTASGSQIVFYTSPNNSVTKTESASISSVGISAANIIGNHTHPFRNLGDVSSQSISANFETDDLLFCSFTSNFSINFTNIQPGKVITIIATNNSTGGADIITLGIPNKNMSNNDNTTTVSNQRTAFIRAWAVGTTVNDVFCQITYG